MIRIGTGNILSSFSGPQKLKEKNFELFRSLLAFTVFLITFKK